MTTPATVLRDREVRAVVAVLPPVVLLVQVPDAVLKEIISDDLFAERLDVFPAEGRWGQRTSERQTLLAELALCMQAYASRHGNGRA